MKTRVMVVDDSVIVRRMVSEVLNADPALEVVATASNGSIALQKLPQVNPEIVLLDVEMPEVDGIQTLRSLRKDYPRMPVIMFSAVTEKGAAATIEALASGANDYVAKPSQMKNAEETRKKIIEEVIPKIKTFAQLAPAPAKKNDKPGVTARLTVAPQRLDIVAIGVSTGGPNALSVVIPHLPPELPVPVVIVQHMPPLFTKYLAERLQANSNLRVKEGEEGEVLIPGVVYLAPGGSHMVVSGEATAKLSLNQDPPEHSCRPAVDVLFRSVVKNYGARALGVILTGMGNDGLLGCQMLKNAGGVVVAQDEATSIVWGMPGFVARQGLADAVLPVGGIASEICARLQFGRTQRVTASN